MTKDIFLTNSATGQKTVFQPADPTSIGMYVCGPTVYNRAHIGNARSAVVFDLLYRLLMNNFGEEAVVYARNFTDIDDKIMARAEEVYPAIQPLQAIAQLTQGAIRLYHKDMGSLGVLRPTHEPRATSYVEEMIADISTMINRGGAYEADGHVFFSSEKNAHRGTLSGRSDLNDDTVHRVDHHPLKRHPADFILWKPSTNTQPGWESPWGTGRPGWHIECSTMATRLLGQNFDIHGGGSDLMFPHHDNEISQARCCAPKAEYARTWLHNGMITVKGQKMSKSLGNMVTVADLRAHMPGGAIRLALLSAQYRNSLDWTSALEAQSLSAWRRFSDLARNAEPGAEVPQEILAVLLDDLNTPKAIADLHALAAAGNGPGLRAALDLLGISTEDDRISMPVPLVRAINKLVADRDAARAARDFSTADSIRDSLLSAGIALKDGSDGTRWEATANFNPDLLPDIS